MTLISELTTVYNSLDIYTIIDWKTLVLLWVFLLYLTGLGFIAINHDSTIAIASPSDPITHSDYEWDIPVGSPEIGMRPDGSVGSINNYGRISAV